MSVGTRERLIGAVLVVGVLASLASAYSYAAALRDGEAAHAAISVFLVGIAVGVTLLGVHVAADVP